MNFPDFLDAYMEYTYNSESPDNYHRWIALSILGAVVGKRVYFDGGTFRTYANTFVLLIGPPGRTRKSSAMKMGRDLIKEVPGIGLAPQSVSREKFIDLIVDSYDKDKGESNVYVSSGEFGSLVTTSGNNLLQLFTDIYNGDEETFRHETRGSGEAVAENFIVSIIGATTPTWMANEYPAASIGDGFGARLMLVYEENKRKIIPFPPPLDKKIQAKLIDDLTAISEIEGAITFSSKGAERYSNIYSQINKIDRTASDQRLESYDDRLDVHIQKTAILCCLSRGSNVIDPKDLDRALDIISALEKNLAKIYGVMGDNRTLSVTLQIIEEVKSRGQVQVSDILKRFGHVGSMQELDQAIAMATNMGNLKLVVDAEKGTSLRV